MAADLTKSKEIAKAERAFEAASEGILATEQGTIGRASSAFALITSEADATYKSKVDTATFGLLATSTAATAKYDAAVTTADATFAATSQWAADQRDATKASADAEEASTLATIAAGFEASASAAVGAFETSVAATTASADATQKRLDAAADALVAYGTRLQDEIIASAKLWHDGAIIAAGLQQHSESTAAANGLADAKKKNEDQYTATVGLTSGGAAGAGSSSLDIGSAPLVVAAVSSATGQFQIDISAAQNGFQSSVGIAADSFDAIMKLAGDRYDQTIADADAALAAAQAAAAAAQAAAERAAEQAHAEAIAAAKESLAATKARAESAYEQSLATAQSAYDATVTAATAVHDQVMAVAKATFDADTATARATWQSTTATANDSFLRDSDVVRADAVTAENNAIAVFDAAVAIASSVHDVAAAQAAADRDTAIATAEATDATEQAKIRDDLAKQMQAAAENFAAAATGIEKGHRGAEVLETQLLTGSVKKICDAAAASLQSIQAGASRALAPLLAQLGSLTTSVATSQLSQRSTMPPTGSMPPGGTSSPSTGSTTTNTSNPSAATQALMAATQAKITAIQKDANDRAAAEILAAAAKGEDAVRAAGDGATAENVSYARALAQISMTFLIDCVKADTSADARSSASKATLEIAVAKALAAEGNALAAAGATLGDSIAAAAEARDNTIAGINASAAVAIAKLERAHQMALANADAVRDMTLATVADTFANTAAMAENTLAAAISGASMRLVSEQGQAFLVLTVTTASAEAAAELAITAADGGLEMALASATATSVTIVAAAESAHGVSITDAGLSLAATGYGAVQGFFGAVSSAAGTFVASIGAAVSNQIGTIGSAVTTVVNTWALGQSQTTGDALKAKVSAGLAKSGADALAEVAAYGRQVLADIAYQGAIAGADAKLVMQEALGASVFVHTVLPGLAAITGDKARAMVAATGEIVAAINGLQATLQGLTVSATVQGAAAAVRHAVSLTKADMDHLVTVTVAAGKASTDVSIAGVELAAVIGAASVDAYDQMTAALVVHTMQVGLAAVLMTARIGAAATLATHDLGLARIALQGAVGVADVTWATSVANAQSAYDALMGRGQVAAAERLRDPFETYKAKQAQIGGDLRTALAVNDVQRKIAAEQHASGSGGFNGDWSKAFTYVIGGLQMVGGAIEVTVGAKLLVAAAASGATGVGIPIAFISGTLGAFMVGHGLDNLNTGFQTIVTGAPQRTLTSQALDSLTGNEFYSEVADTVLGLLSGAAAGKIFRLAAMTDDMGRCLNMMGRMFYGGCFTGDTLVHVTAVADEEISLEHARHSDSSAATATATQCLAIAKVPIGARVLAENPRPEEFDDSFAEPVQSEWARVSFLIVRNDLSVVEAEFIRPRAWIESLGLVKGARLDLAVPELGIDGLAEVTAVRACPPIAEGEGRVVTGRFVTRDVANVVRMTLANGTEIRATDVHPVWSIDREDWVPAGKLEAGEHVDTLTGPVAVASVEPLDRHPAVYNLEVHGEHVYRIAVDGVLVHNGTLACHALGQAGESAADIVKNTYHIPSLSGKALFRIPDELSKTTLREVKNVAYQHFSTQLQDMLHFSMETGREMTLVVRRSTVLSNDLLAAIRAGWINLEHLP